jgi:hypothetical protein
MIFQLIKIIGELYYILIKSLARIRIPLLIFDLKKPFVISNNENTTDSPRIPKITSYLNNGYVSGYNIKFILYKLIIILSLLFFQITNVGKAAALN